VFKVVKVELIGAREDSEDQKDADTVQVKVKKFVIHSNKVNLLICPE